MITELIDSANRNRPDTERQITKKQVIAILQKKGLVKGYQYGIAMFNKLDHKEQDRISIPILLELAEIFNCTTDEILSNYQNQNHANKHRPICSME